MKFFSTWPYWLRGAVLLPSAFYCLWGFSRFAGNLLGNSDLALPFGLLVILIEAPAGAFDQRFGWKLTIQRNNPVFNSTSPTGFLYLIIFYLVICSLLGGVLGFIYGKLKS